MIVKSLVNILRVSVCLLVMVGFTGCKTPKDVTYFQDISENVYTLPEAVQTRIRPFDKLSIVVKAKDAGLSTLFNKTLPYDRIGDGYSDYLVSKDGMIDFPLLGELKVEGMTRDELAAFIKGDLIGKGYVKELVVTVDFLNLGYSVMGEVAKAGRYGLVKDEMTVLDAIALAGDLTIQGRRDNVKVIRRDGNTTHTYIIDLTNFGELMKSPAYFVKQDDIIYIEPTNIRKRETTNNGNNVLNIGFWVSIASLLTSMAVLIIK